jgi:hypothetical protein
MERPSPSHGWLTCTFGTPRDNSFRPPRNPNSKVLRRRRSMARQGRYGRALQDLRSTVPLGRGYVVDFANDRMEFHFIPHAPDSISATDTTWNSRALSTLIPPQEYHPWRIRPPGMA